MHWDLGFPTWAEVERSRRLVSESDGASAACDTLACPKGQKGYEQLKV